MAPSAESHRIFDWYLTIVLASINGLLLFTGLALNVLSLILGDDFIRDQAIEIPDSFAIFSVVLTMVLILSVFWFWFRMLNDYFRNRPEKHTIAWGWALFILSIGASLAYFWLIWRPRNRPIYSSEA